MFHLNHDTQEKQGTYLLPSTKCWFHVFFHQKYNFSSLYKWNVLLEIFEKSLFHYYILRQKIQPWTRMYIILKDAQGFFVVFRSQRKVLDRKAKGRLFIQTSLLHEIRISEMMSHKWPIDGIKYWEENRKAKHKNRVNDIQSFFIHFSLVPK